MAGARRRVAAPLAAYINAQLTNFFDFDDTLEGRALGHPGATVIPAAMVGPSRRAQRTQSHGWQVEVYRGRMAGKPSFER